MNNFRFAFYIIFAAWIIHTIDFILPGISFSGLGVTPRDTSGLIGILTMPFLHGDWNHLFGNTISIIVFLPLTILLAPNHFKMNTVYLIILSGIGVWIFARGNTHVGMSALIFGYFGYCMCMSIKDRTILGFVLCLIIMTTQSSMFSSILPFTTAARVSWEGHLFGIIAGILVGLHTPATLNLSLKPALKSVK